MNKRIIGFTGVAGSGKDTAAIELSKGHTNVDLLAFSKPLKDACAILFGFTEEQLYDPVQKEVMDPKWERTPRYILQWLGTDILRKHINDNIFLMNMSDRIAKSSADTIIITDVRFDNEAKLIRSLGGTIVKIVRPKVVKDAVTVDTVTTVVKDTNYFQIAKEKVVETFKGITARIFGNKVHSSEQGIHSYLVDIVIDNNRTLEEFQEKVRKLQ